MIIGQIVIYKADLNRYYHTIKRHVKKGGVSYTAEFR